MKKVNTLLFAIALSYGACAQWTKYKNSSLAGNNRVICPVSNDVVLVGSGHGVLARTTDACKTWDWQHVGYDAVDMIVFVDSKTGYLYSIEQKLMKTVDSGNKWTEQSDSLYLTSLCFTGDDIGYATSENLLFKTADGGLNWDTASFPPDIRLTEIYFPTSTTGYVVGSDGNDSVLVMKTSDAGASWRDVSPGYAGYLTSMHFVDASVGYAVGYEKGWIGIILKTSDGGATWEKQSPPGNLVLTSICFGTADFGYAVGDEFILKTMDGGATWVEDYHADYKMTDVAFLDATTAYATGYVYAYKNENASGITTAPNSPEVTVHATAGSGLLTVCVRQDAGAYAMKVYDAKGTLHMESKGEREKEELDISTLPGGFYYLKLEGERFSTARSFIKR